MIDAGLAGTFHSVVTDPPYHLTTGKKGGTGVASANPNSPAGRAMISTGFMGKAWDGGDVAFQAATWKLAFELLRPGGHLLAFGGSRTYHRLAVAVEDAGFEIRDQIMWVFGSGFPKSVDIAKAIDNAGGMSPDDQAALLKDKRQAAGLSRDGVAAAVGCTHSSVRDWEEGRARAIGLAPEHIVPSKKYRAALAELLGYSSDERRQVGVSGDRRGDETVFGIGHSGSLTAGGNTEAAMKWQGFGSALKPSHEPIVVARKPLIGTLVENVMAHGCGGINIDGCRVPGEPVRIDNYKSNGVSGCISHTGGVGHSGREYSERIETSGRWPANLIHDGSYEVVSAFPVSSSTTGVRSARSQEYALLNLGAPLPGSGKKGGPKQNEYADCGSPARFFYVAKTSKAERAGSKHPTVKPIALMRYLCRLVTPPGGLILDPFAGSGTTLEAALLEGFQAIGCEMTPEYYPDIDARLRRAQPMDDVA